MLNRIAFDLFPPDATRMFRQLNGCTMPDILDTLDALMKQKNFVPNQNTWRAELDRAGIFVARMEVAMAAVLAKAAGRTYQTFSSERAASLMQLPADQRDSIAAYMAGKSGQSGAPSDDAQFELNLANAKRALLHTRLLFPGPGNRALDGGPLSVVNTIDAKIRGRKTDGSNVDVAAQIAREAGGGNCDEFSSTAFVFLRGAGVRQIYWYKLQGCGDHAFVLVGEIAKPFTIGLDDLKDWGRRVAVCDAWANDCYRAAEIPMRMSPLNGQFAAMCYAQA